MHLRLLAILTLVWDAITMSSSARKRSASREDPEDCRSCLECSRDNGCVRCPERLFLFLLRDGMSHHGSCLHACPVGHYGQRGQDINRCLKCRSADCERCFSRDFCTKCKADLQLFRGRCYRRCPAGTVPQLTDCVEGCVQGPEEGWGDWSVCMRGNFSCGFRWGRQNRTRGPSWSTPDEKTNLCPPQSETRSCRMKKKCPKERKRGGGRRRGKKRLQLLTNGTVTEATPP